MAEYRITSVGAEVAYENATSDDVSLTNISAELMLRSNDPKVRVTQVFADVLIQLEPPPKRVFPLPRIEQQAHLFSVVGNHKQPRYGFQDTGLIP